MLLELSRTVRRRPPRLGITLIELLVVMFIMLILTTVALPMLQPDDDSRRIREAARMINVYLGSARSRAMETGRPCGVVLQRMEGQPNAAFILRQAEVPPPYAGDTTGASATVQDVTSPPTSTTRVVQINFQNSCISDGLFTSGDLIQLNHQGPWLTIFQPTGQNYDSDGDGFFDTMTISAQADLSAGGQLPWPSGSTSAPVPFEIKRQPRQTSVAAPLQLPTPVVVDLFYSGMDPLDPTALPNDPLGNTHLLRTTVTTGAVDPVLLFSPNGSLEAVYYDNAGAIAVRAVTSPLYLLLGTSERVRDPVADPYSGTPADEELPNWIVPTSKWISVSPQTGVVTTEQNYFVDPSSVTWTATTNWPTHLYNTRTYAREAQNMGGR